MFFGEILASGRRQRSNNNKQNQALLAGSSWKLHTAVRTRESLISKSNVIKIIFSRVSLNIFLLIYLAFFLEFWKIDIIIDICICLLFFFKCGFMQFNALSCEYRY